MHIILVLYLKMAKLEDIIHSVVYDMIARNSGVNMPFIVANNEYSKIPDPSIVDAKEVALKDMVESKEFLHPELTDSE